MSARELAEWEAEYSIEPWGDFRLDFAVARLERTLAILHGNADATAAQFMPRFGQEPEDDDPDPEVLQRKAMLLNVAMGGTLPGT